MRSPADLSASRRARRSLEWTLRAALIIALLLAIREALSSINQKPTLTVRGGDASLRSALRDWSTATDPAAVRVAFDSVPSRIGREWTAALRGTGTRVEWVSSLAPLAISVEPVADPKRKSRIWLAAPGGSRIVIADSLGMMDSASVRKIGAAVGPVMLHGSARASVGATSAVADASNSLVVRPILILGRAGWEGKFIAAALEEYGWQVDARLTVSPGNEIVQGSVTAVIDTSRYAAVIVVDSSASRYSAAIAQYVRRGGGLIATGEGASLAALRGILPAVAVADVPAGDVSGANPRAGLALRTLTQMRRDAVAIEKRGSRIAIGARREGSGRVMEIGYDDSWRWRMGGSGDPVEDYRNWWSSVVSSAAYAPLVVVKRTASDPVPLAALFEELGPPTIGAVATGITSGETLLVILFAVAVAALVLETASRRLDGMP